MRVRIFLVLALVAVLLAPVGAGGAPGRAQTTVTIAAAGDIARSKPGTPQKQTAALITDVIHPSTVLMLGDSQYEHGAYNEYLKSYDPTWGAFKSITAPTLGNHEYETPNADGYFRYFQAQLAPYGPSASDPDAGYYSFNVGDWHVVALNSNCGKVSCPAQATWLKQDVAADGHLCEVVIYHHPNERSFANAANAAGVDLILAGHKHTYERWNRLFGLNVREFVVGTGGDSSGAPRSNADAGAKAYGVLRLDLSPTGYGWSFIDVAKHVRDSGSDSCHD
jgi:Calcineurin-like phosphoesterase